MSDRLVDGAAPDALGADSSASHLPIFAYNFDTLKIHFELATGDTRDLGTNTPQVLRFTTRFNRITDLGLLATNLTLAGHGRGSFLFFIAQSDFCSHLQQKLSLRGVGVLHLVRCGNPVWILKGCVEARSIPVDLMSATPKRAHVVNFGAGRERCCRAKWVARMIRHRSSRTIRLDLSFFLTPVVQTRSLPTFRSPRS